MPIDFAADFENIFLNGDFGESITWISGGTETEIRANVKRGTFQRQVRERAEVAVDAACMVSVAAADVTPKIGDEFRLSDGKRYLVEAFDALQEGAHTVIGKRVVERRRGASEAKESV